MHRKRESSVAPCALSGLSIAAPPSRLVCFFCLPKIGLVRAEDLRSGVALLGDRLRRNRKSAKGRVAK